MRVQLFLLKFHGFIYHFQSEAGIVANAKFALQTSALLPLAYTLTLYCFSFWLGLALWTIDRTHSLKTNPTAVEYVLNGNCMF